jgi:hypothetical protein
MGEQLDLFGGAETITAAAAPKKTRTSRPTQFALFTRDEAITEAAKPADERFAGAFDLTSNA